MQVRKSTPTETKTEERGKRKERDSEKGQRQKEKEYQGLLQSSLYLGGQVLAYSPFV